jgi:hypothetical protein
MSAIHCQTRLLRPGGGFHHLPVIPHDAVDELWASAERDGLVAKLGTDAVQRLLADAFAPERDDPPRDEQAPAADFAEACHQADQKQHRKPSDPRVPETVLQAAVYLVQQGDADRWRQWFDTVASTVTCRAFSTWTARNSMPGRWQRTSQIPDAQRTPLQPQYRNRTMFLDGRLRPNRAVQVRNL